MMMTYTNPLQLALWLGLLSVWVRAGPPVIDLTPLFQADHAQQWDATLQQMDQALREHGVFVVTHHGIDVEEEEVAFQSAKALFSLSAEEKNAVNVKQSADFGRGYLSFGSESGLSEIFEPKEGYSYGYPHAHNEPRNMLNGPNHWPKALSVSAQHSLEEMYLKFTQVANKIVKNLQSYRMQKAPVEVQVGGKTRSRSTAQIQVDGGEYISLMRLFHYFPLQSEVVKQHQQSAANTHKKALGSSPHTDWGLLTVILQNDVNGLQYMHKGDWVDVPYIPNSLIINIGDFFSLSSNGDYHSPVHRVLCPQERDRTSFVLFYYPHYDSNLTIYEGDSVVEEQNQRIDEAGAVAMCAEGETCAVEGGSSGEAFNTLTSLQGQQSNEGVKFGDYIVQKWKDVFRASKAY